MAGSGVNVPTVLPEAGVIEVLKHAVYAYPLITLILVLATILIFAGIVCWTIVARTRYQVLKDPSVAKVMRLMEQDERVFRAQIKGQLPPATPPAKARRK